MCRSYTIGWKIAETGNDTNSRAAKIKIGFLLTSGIPYLTQSRVLLPRPRKPPSSSTCPPPAPLQTVLPSRKVALGIRSTRACMHEPLREVLVFQGCTFKVSRRTSRCDVPSRVNRRKSDLELEATMCSGTTDAISPCARRSSRLRLQATIGRLQPTTFSSR